MTYAALADWTPQDSNDTTRDHVLAAMRDIGPFLKESLSKVPTG